MADEQYEQLGGQRVVPAGFGWPSLLRRSGVELEQHYSTILEELGTGDDLLGVVFRKARNRVQDPAKLERLIKEFVDRHEWLSLDADLKGDAYEGLIEKTAQEGARGAGQYFTPRALISAIVDVMGPGPDDRICDPAPTTASATRPAAPAVSSWAPTPRSSSASPTWSLTRPRTCGRGRSPAGRSPTCRPVCVP